MENEPLFQVLCFGKAMLFGAAAGAGYECMGVFRMLGRFWLTSLCDTCFWLITAPAAFLFFLRINGGAPRGFLLTAILAGMVLVHGTLGRWSESWTRSVAERLQALRRRRKAFRAKKNASEGEKKL